MTTNPLAAFPFIQPIEVRFRDLDALGHVNNAVYLTYLESARIAYYLRASGASRLDQVNLILAEVTVTYRAPAYFGDSLAVGVRVSSIGNKSFAMEYMIARTDDGTIVATGRSVQVAYDYEAGHSIPVPDSFREQVAKLQGPFNAET